MSLIDIARMYRENKEEPEEVFFAKIDREIALLPQPKPADYEQMTADISMQVGLASGLGRKKFREHTTPNGALRDNDSVEVISNSYMVYYSDYVEQRAENFPIGSHGTVVAYQRNNEYIVRFPHKGEWTSAVRRKFLEKYGKDTASYKRHELKRLEVITPERAYRRVINDIITGRVDQSKSVQRSEIEAAVIEAEERQGIRQQAAAREEAILGIMHKLRTHGMPNDEILNYCLSRMPEEDVSRLIKFRRSMSR